MEVKTFVTQELNKEKIPLLASNGKSYVTAIVEGQRASGLSAQGFTSFSKKYFPNKPKNVRILTYLCSIVDSKYCYRCSRVLNLTEFHRNNSRKDGYNTYCKDCKSQHQKDYYSSNKDVFINSNIKRKLNLKEATPGWANLNLIKEIYANCPPGYHVDHIYPLRGKNSCGLHVENNLQYLTVIENLKKGNKEPE